ncbi:MAG: hypothetical protein JW384_02296 [Nitrosomonadaceae bacterium]|nr:hypothetical protein [Nitrosomonadaceae bacterium]
MHRVAVVLPGIQIRANIVTSAGAVDEKSVSDRWFVADNATIKSRVNA